MTSAVQLASSSGVAQPASGAAQPAPRPVFGFSAYNVGWQFNDKKRDAWWLGAELVRHWHESNFHAIGISEVFEVEYPAADIGNVDERF